MVDPMVIKANEDNNNKFLTGEFGEEQKKKKKKQLENFQITESKDEEPPIEYFTE